MIYKVTDVHQKKNKEICDDIILKNKITENNNNKYPSLAFVIETQNNSNIMSGITNTFYYDCLETDESIKVSIGSVYVRFTTNSVVCKIKKNLLDVVYYNYDYCNHIYISLTSLLFIFSDNDCKKVTIYKNKNKNKKSDEGITALLS